MGNPEENGAHNYCCHRLWWPSPIISLLSLARSPTKYAMNATELVEQSIDMSYLNTSLLSPVLTALAGMG